MFRSHWFAAAVALSACGGESENPGRELSGPQAPTSWPLYESACGYSFRAPPDLRERPAQPIDSCISIFENADCELQGDLGGFSDPLDSYTSSPEFQATAAVIDGRPARLVRFRQSESTERAEIAAVHFPDIRASTPGVKLTLWTSCAAAAPSDDMVQVLWSIRFPAR